MKNIYIPLLFVLLFLPSCAKQPVQPVPPPLQHETTDYIHPTQRPYKIMGKKYYPLPSSEGYIKTGVASWYGPKFHGRKTSNGETYNMYDKTAAHKTLPMNTYVLVENLENNREMVVRINDRGPFVKNRIIDLSLTAAQQLGVVKNGTAKVKLTAMGEAATMTRGGKEVDRFLPHQDFTTGNFYVQIGAFSNQDNATRLKQTMKEWGKQAEVLLYDRGDQLFYRVQVYAGSTLTAAKKMEQGLEQAGFDSAFVIAR